jgi:hypothetical protein
MKLPAFLVVILLAACAYAQTDQPSATPPSNAPATDQTPSANQTQTEPAPAQSSTDATSDAKNTTIRGCLEGGTDRGYTITDKNGTRYALTGTNVNALISHVGEEVDLDGEPAPGSDVSGTGSATTESATDKPAATPSQTFKVSDVRKVSDKCAI